MMDAALIAPCGMNCKLCVAHMRKKNKCPGCNGAEQEQPPYCARCSIRHCEMLQQSKSNLCCECVAFPCARLRRLDRRYRTEYRMSMIDNLETILKAGMDAFLKEQQARWTCPTCGGVICVHKGECLRCSAND
ncbi:MAG: DUF3795 domain-containing protein [Christensenellales bacterium]